MHSNTSNGPPGPCIFCRHGSIQHKKQAFKIGIQDTAIQTGRRKGRSQAANAGRRFTGL